MPAVKAPTPKQTFEPDVRQSQAIEHVDGPMLVVAGAGTGKTTVLTKRIARLVREGHAQPEEILALTYTENAAAEMRQRVQAELHETGSVGLKAETFHAYCNNLLHRYGREFGLLDDQDLWIFLRRRLSELHLRYFVRAANVAQFLDDLLNFIRRCQDDLVTPSMYAEYVTRLERGELPIPRVGKSKDASTITDEEVLARCREISQVFAKVEEMLQQENLGTFGHMITRAYDLLENNAEILEKERQKIRFILIDEFQDANFAQVKILQKLAGEARNVFAVGDPDQAIYHFRGASSAAFQLFQRSFPASKLVVLDRNRRSLTPILKCAFALIQKNPPFFSQDASLGYQRSHLISARDEEAQRSGKPSSAAPVEAVVLSAKEIESSDLAASLIEKHKQSKWKDMAVLYRSHFHRDELAAELAEREIPFSIENLDVLDTSEARDLFACLGGVVSEADGASLLRVAALGKFNIDGQKLRQAIRQVRKSKGEGIALALREVDGGGQVLETLQMARQQIGAASARSREALEIIAQCFGLSAKSPVISAILDFASRWEKKKTTKTGEIAEFLDYFEYFREARGTICLPPNENADAVRLMTVHSAKGLEFRHVFIIRAISGSFPCSYKEPLLEFPRDLRRTDSAADEEGKTLHEEEERRLFYVAMTRARDTLTLYAKQGRGKKDPSPPGYIRELLQAPTVKQWFRQRPARAFQTDMFAGSPVTQSRTTQWLSVPPENDLSARLSASAVQTYTTCPLQFKLEREWKIPGDAPAAMQNGAVMHDVLRAYYESVRAERPMDEPTLLELFKANLANARIADEYQHEVYEKQGIAQLREFLSLCGKNPVPQVLHTEERFEVKIGEAVVIGRIDRVDQNTHGHVVITDYKTGKAMSQEDADESLQLSIYAMAAKEKWGYVVGGLAFYNLAENYAVTTGRGDLELREARLLIEDVAAKIAAKQFEPKPGFHCRFCAYHNLCPATEKRVYGISSASN
ncbi:MAG TPA: ATP-dependent DNA helicase [Terriglobales bacterium]|jgi:DNA helicase-2/ATP-dependent DNA helicase PcrA